MMSKQTGASAAIAKKVSKRETTCGIVYKLWNKNILLVFGFKVIPFIQLWNKNIQLVFGFKVIHFTHFKKRAFFFNERELNMMSKQTGT